MRELVVLGTASAVPTRDRNHNGYLLRWDGEGLLFDPGEGTQRQLTLAGAPASSVTRVCLTHVHGDHCLGLPGVLSRMVLDGVQHPVHLHYPASGGDVVRALVSLATPGLDLHLHPHGGAGEVADGLSVVPLAHRVETYGYLLVEPDGQSLDADALRAAGVVGPDVGRLRREGRLGAVRLADVSRPRRGQRFAVVMDTAVCDGAVALADDADVLLIESTYDDALADLAREHRHLTAGQAGAIAAAGGAHRVVLTHFSARYTDTAPLVAQARAHLGDRPVHAAVDGDRIALPRRRSARAGAVGPAGASP